MPNNRRGTSADMSLRNSTGRRWRSETSTRLVSPSRITPAETESEADQVFSIARGPSVSVSSELEFWPELDSRGTLFLPPRAAFVGAAVDALEISLDHNVYAPELPSGYSYRVLTSTELVEPLTAEDRERMLHLPDGEVADAVRAVADRLFQPGQTFDERLHAVRKYFHEQHLYSTDVRVTAAREPLAWFLEKRAAAHCEYFASAAAAVLRAGAIPTRYVTGFVTPERNLYGGYFVVRNRYAHAWTQAWSPTKGWVDVDATPTAGLPRATETPGRFGQFWEYLKDRIGAARARFHQRGFLWFAARAVLWRPAADHIRRRGCPVDRSGDPPNTRHATRARRAESQNPTTASTAQPRRRCRSIPTRSRPGQHGNAAPVRRTDRRRTGRARQ